jgi:hypothetical protein
MEFFAFIGAGFSAYAAIRLVMAVRRELTMSERERAGYSGRFNSPDRK